jgi:hypothetical protein
MCHTPAHLDPEPRGPSHTAKTRQADAATTTVHRFPLRPASTVAIELPNDLHGQEPICFTPGWATSPPKLNTRAPRTS